MIEPKNILIGFPEPLGVSFQGSEINFSVFSENANQVTLCLFTPERKQISEISMNRTEDVWHVSVQGLSLPVLYAYQANGPQTPPHYFRPDLLLLDPYAKEISSTHEWGTSDDYWPLGKISRPKAFDWRGTTHPKIPSEDLIIYEIHVRSFTQDSSSKVQLPGTYSGIIEKIPHFLDLGINAVELMPLYEFNESGYQAVTPQTNQRLYNYWGYSSVNFFSPMNRYANKETLSEFKMMVRELHKQGIEVILDVVYNHTAEKMHEKHAYSFLGLDRSVYYMLSGDDECNYSGCGHTMNLNHPIMRRLVRDSLKYWVEEMHIDGFRFDLAAIMSRDQDGQLLDPSPLIEEISLNSTLSQTKLIAEPWDLDTFQLGGFYPQKDRWSEWNGKYRDAIRSFIKGDSGSKGEFAKRISGSYDLFSSRSPQASVNFVTVHDGFSLADLVSYDEKHNEANGEHNQDGNSHNISWNCGVEGKTQDPKILSLRKKQMKNFLLALFFSPGIPLLFMGDEYGHTKKGNNNTWCQDNKLNWFSWDRLSEEKDYFSFVQKLIRIRRQHKIFSSKKYDHKITWFGKEGKEIDWEDPVPFLACSMSDDKDTFYFAFNATPDSASIALPNPDQGKQWHLLADTDSDEAKALKSTKYTQQAYSSIACQLQG